MDAFTGGELRNKKYSETDFGHVLFLIYKYYNLVSDFDFVNLQTNCSLPILHHYDKSPSKLTHSCLPEDFIRSVLLRNQHIEADTDKHTMVNTLTNMVRTDNVEDLLEWMKKNKFKQGHIDFARACYKPYRNEELVGLEDFSRLTNADKTKSQRNYWISNNTIRAVLLPYAKIHDIKFMGTIFLNFLGNIPPLKQSTAFKNSSIYKQFGGYLKETRGKGYTRCVGFVSLYDHWSTILIDFKAKVAYYYNSHGYIHSVDTPSILEVYSYDRYAAPVLPHIPGRIGQIQSSVNMFLLFVAKQAGLRKIVVNHEQAQLQDGECGVFSMVFAILMMENYASPYKVYTFYKFFGDKRIREFRELLFIRSKTITINSIKHPMCEYNDKSKKILMNILEELENH